MLIDVWISQKLLLNIHSLSTHFKSFLSPVCMTIEAAYVQDVAPRGSLLVPVGSGYSYYYQRHSTSVHGIQLFHSIDITTL